MTAPPGNVMMSCVSFRFEEARGAHAAHRRPDGAAIQLDHHKHISLLKGVDGHIWRSFV